jgi:archaeal type IV pilus assembly protein PilA
MKQPNVESAVSETIATVLMVALVVILAAIVAAYMFGMLNGVPPARLLAVTADQPDPSHIIVTYRGGPNQAGLSNLSITWPSGATQAIPFPKVGDVYTATNIAAPYNVTSGRDHVVVVALYPNNESTVVLDTFV